MKHDSSSCIANEHYHHDQRVRKPIDHYFFGIYQVLKDNFRPENQLFRRFCVEPLAFERNVGQTWELHRIVEKDFLHRIQALKTKIHRTFPFRQGSFSMPPPWTPLTDLLENFSFHISLRAPVLATLWWKPDLHSCSRSRVIQLAITRLLFWNG